jgi:hypothetical protein
MKNLKLLGLGAILFLEKNKLFKQNIAFILKIFYNIPNKYYV